MRGYGVIGITGKMGFSSLSLLCRTCTFFFTLCSSILKVSQVASVVKNPPAYAVDAEDTDSIPGWKWYSRGTNGYQLWYSCLENPMGRRLWRAQSMGSQRTRHNLATEHNTAVCYSRFDYHTSLFPTLLQCSE